MKFLPFGKRKNPRKVRGFLCDKTLWIAMRALTQQLNVPLYCTVEHALQLGSAAILEALSDEKAKLKLIDHLTQDHLLKPLLDPENPYDRRVLAKAKLLEVRRQEFEEFTRDFMKVCDEEDIEPGVLLIAARSMLDALRERRRQHDDIPHRWQQS